MISSKRFLVVFLLFDQNSNIAFITSFIVYSFMLIRILRSKRQYCQVQSINHLLSFVFNFPNSHMVDHQLIPVRDIRSPQTTTLRRQTVGLPFKEITSPWHHQRRYPRHLLLPLLLHRRYLTLADQHPILCGCQVPYLHLIT